MYIVIGFVGMVLLQCSSLFQIIHFIRSKETSGVPINFWFSLWIGLVLNLIYSISVGDIIFITSNVIGLILTSITIFLYFFYKKKDLSI